MYQILCDDYPLLDLRDDELIVSDPKLKLEVNTVGEGSFTIYDNHPNFNVLQKMRSVFEISDEFGVLFRGRMTEHTQDFYNAKAVDLEGAMAFFNDSVVPPHKFPEDFLENEDYISTAESGNVVEFYLSWFLENHNSQVQPHQRFNLGNVTVSDPNNYITREETGYPNTWESLKSKLFESALGGNLCIRYEEDGNYIDYLAEFTLTNTQDIEFGVNMLDLKHGENAKETYSAIIPIGAEIEIVVETEPEPVAEEGDDTETETEPETIKKKLTLESIEDGAINDDIYKITLDNGLHAIYSKNAVDEYGWICAPVTLTTWEDVTDVQNLLTKGSNWISTQGVMLEDTVEIAASDLHFTDKEIQSFRIYRKINMNSLPHDMAESFDLTKLELELLNPQNTKITVGRTRLTLTDRNNKGYSETIEKIQSAEKNIAETKEELTTEVKNQILAQSTSILNTCESIILKALETYVETGNYEEFQRTVNSQLTLLAGEMTLKFSETTTQINNVNGDLQETITKLEKFFDFTLEDGLIIKAGENKMQLQLDNDIISFKKNGEQFGWWDGVDFHTGNIIVGVDERAQFGSFAYVPRSDGSLMFLKVGE